MKQSGKRQLKIHRKYFSRSYRRYVVFPEIRLCGKWLQNIGFVHGKFVTVQHEKNKIIITANKEIEKVIKK
ncbi:SymE family type I addiction module toxin [Flavobacterium sp. N1736]|uniref:SymE family type I addiction module toxin n=1 Tax=Flavobacterium sp. N1736 TaxID=2986823 RepID=UPI0022246D24|nr:SymE family type I addiction module toxin [Flavobacterium sp. N1736]